MHENSNNVVCATSKGSDQTAQTCSLVRAFACRLNIQWVEHHLEFLSLKGDCIGSSESTLVKMPHTMNSKGTHCFFQNASNITKKHVLAAPSSTHIFKIRIMPNKRDKWSWSAHLSFVWSLYIGIRSKLGTSLVIPAVVIDGPRTLTLANLIEVY